MPGHHNERVVGSRVQGSPDPSVADTPVLPQMMSRGNSELRKAAGNLIPQTVPGVQDTMSIIYSHTLSYGTEKWVVKVPTFGERGTVASHRIETCTSISEQ